MITALKNMKENEDDGRCTCAQLTGRLKRGPSRSEYQMDDGAIASLSLNTSQCFDPCAPKDGGKMVTAPFHTDPCCFSH